MARKPTDTVQLNLRFSESLRRRLERAADANNCSLNSEIVVRLEQSFRREDFQKVQDAVNKGMMEIIGVTLEVAKHIPPVPKGRSLLDLAQYLPKDQTATQEPASLPEAQSTGRKEVLEMSDDELAKRIAEAEAAEQRAPDKRDDSK
jgi:Arc-like DNA binding domain